MKTNIYQKVTDGTIADLKKGELKRIKPWRAGNMEGRIIEPLRHSGMRYNGINILMLWRAAFEGRYLSPYGLPSSSPKSLLRMPK